mmetsp:Transcript_46661/g.110968  ORF Transcript_46661/g.110968 Transcript_46661/m.110968 type:complete len:231 (-) Transcript_46661:731-1423(-)
MRGEAARRRWFRRTGALPWCAKGVGGSGDSSHISGGRGHGHDHHGPRLFRTQPWSRPEHCLHDDVYGSTHLCRLGRSFLEALVAMGIHEGEGFGRDVLIDHGLLQRRCGLSAADAAGQRCTGVAFDNCFACGQLPCLGGSSSADQVRCHSLDLPLEADHLLRRVRGWGQARHVSRPGVAPFCFHGTSVVLACIGLWPHRCAGCAAFICCPFSAQWWDMDSSWASGSVSRW